MKVEYVNPFIAATVQAFEVLASWSPARGVPFVKADCIAHGEISGLMVLLGEPSGSVALIMPGTLAQAVYGRIVGEPAAGIDAEVRDAIGELANLIAGGAKAALAESGLQFRMTIPAVSVGKDHVVHHHGEGPYLVVPFSLAGETFWLEISFVEPKRSH